MHIDDLGYHPLTGARDAQGQNTWIQLKPEDCTFMEVKMQILVEKKDSASRHTMAGWVRHYMSEALDIRVNVLGPGKDVAVCEHGHVVPAEDLPEPDACPDCTDEAVTQAERRAEGL